MGKEEKDGDKRGETEGERKERAGWERKERGKGKAKRRGSFAPAALMGPAVVEQGLTSYQIHYRSYGACRPAG